MVTVINIRGNIDCREAVLFSVEKKENDQRRCDKEPSTRIYLSGRLNELDY